MESIHESCGEGEWYESIREMNAEYRPLIGFLMISLPLIASAGTSTLLLARTLLMLPKKAVGRSVTCNKRVTDNERVGCN